MLQFHKTHEEYFKQHYPEHSVVSLLAWVCPNFVTLPQAKLGMVQHAPMCYHDGSGFRWGWPDDVSTIDYLFVLPNVSPLDIHSSVPMNREDMSNDLVVDHIRKAGIPLDRCAFTWAVRFAHPSRNKKFGITHKDSCRVYAQVDIKKVKPKVIVTMGADAMRVLYGKDAKLGNVRGNVLLYEDIPVVTSENPKTFLSGYAGMDVFDAELRRAQQLCAGKFSMERPVGDYTVCETLEDVETLIARIRADKPWLISFDTEWGNDVAREEFSYTMSIQVAWDYGKAAFIKLRGEFGTVIHEEEDYRAILSLVEELFNDPSIQLSAHHLRTDVEQLHRCGIDVDARVADGFCTMLVHHLLYNDDTQGLDNLCRKYTPEFGAFWQPLEDWLDNTGTRNKHLAFGYRDIPHDILVPYALTDADVAWRCAVVLRDELAAQPGLEWLYYNVSAPAALHLMDVERNGVLIDEERRRSILAFYEPVREFYAQRIRSELNWPDMNPGSSDQIKTALYFGCTYSQAKTPPEGVKTLGLKPLYNTDKYPKEWSEIEAMGQEKFNSPSTNNASLEILANQHPDLIVLQYLRHFSAVNKLITNYLYVPELNEYGVPEDGNSLGHNIWADGRARTRLSQLTSTGRYTSSKANLQTWPKKQEAALLAAVVFYEFGCTVAQYQAMCKLEDGHPDHVESDDQIHLMSVKSCVTAPPGRKLIEIDFQTAEVNVWAFVSGDENLIDVVVAGRDLHSENTVNAFQLPERTELPALLEELRNGNPDPYKEWKGRVSKKYESLRIAAKSIIFGVMYGRGASALSREIGKTGVSVTVDQCQQIIDAIAENYPKAWAMLQNNAKSAVENGYAESIFGRRRMFTGIKYCSSQEQGAARRQAMNFGIQGVVADLLAQAGAMLYLVRYRTALGRKLGFDILLPVHDAFLIEVDKDKVDETIKVVSKCMSNMNKIPGTEHYLGVDVDVMTRWGEKEKD